jgi:thiamine-monophosphate kinase
MPREFDLISRYFAPLAGPAGLGLLDDAAVFSPPAGRDLVVTADAIVAGVHFRPQDAPDLVARKLLRVNLSDIAAMGAVAFGYVLTVSVPRDTPEAWFEAFAAGLAADQALFGILLLGGDTTSTPGPVSLSCTMFGHVAPGRALRRGGASAGDLLCVTGTLGDGALGLLALRGEIADPDGYLAGRYLLPRPRGGLELHGIVSAAMDVSDGLVQDAGHMARAAGLGVEIEAARVPRSAAARALGEGVVPVCLTGGDDYELLLAVPPARFDALVTACGDLPVTVIGRFVAGNNVHVIGADGGVIALGPGGFSHF